jgi:hypothetical protein
MKVIGIEKGIRSGAPFIIYGLTLVNVKNIRLASNSKLGFVPLVLM